MKLATTFGVTIAIVLALAVLPAISVGQTITVMGTVIDANGVPIPVANVTLVDDYYYPLGTMTTDANGGFRFVNVSTYGSYLIKPFITYVHDGHNYSTRLENVLWIDASRGIVNIPTSETQLDSYPPSGHGYAWGIVSTGGKNGKSVDSTVYLSNDTTTLVADTDRPGHTGSYQIEAFPGTYEIFAVYCAGNYCLVSNRTTINIAQVSRPVEANPMNLIVDQWVAAENLTGLPTATPASGPGPTSVVSPSPSPVPGASAVKAVPLAVALCFGVLAVIAGWALLNRK